MSQELGMGGACSSNGIDGRPIQNSTEYLKGSLHKSRCRKAVKGMKTYGEGDVQIHIFLISALAGGEWSA
jgi:hypothetical protein